MPIKIHYHSDCEFFSGSENMLANLFNSPAVRDACRISFSYRASDRYTQGLRQRVQSDVALYPVRVANLDTLGWHGRPPTSRLRKLGLALLRQIAYWPLLCHQVWVSYRVLTRVRPDIVHINNGGYPGALSCRAMALAAKWAGVDAVLMVVNNLAVRYDRASRWMDYPCDRLVAAAVDLFVTGSAAAAARLGEVLKLPSEKLKAVHNGIKMRPATLSVAATRERLGLSGYPGAVFGVVALLEPRKGHRILIDAVARLVTAGSRPPGFKVLIEGYGPLQEELEQLVRDRGLTQVVQFVGVAANIFDFMAALDVLVLPSIRDEDFPNVILEAMSLGRPVIASRLAGTPEQVDHGVSGLLVAPGDADALAAALQQLTDAPDQRAEMGAASRRRFDALFSSDIALANYLDLYSHLTTADASGESGAPSNEKNNA